MPGQADLMQLGYKTSFYQLRWFMYNLSLEMINSKCDLSKRLNGPFKRLSHYCEKCFPFVDLFLKL